MILTTARLTLRHAEAHDLSDLHTVLSDARATRWWSTPPHMSLAETQAWLASMIEGNRQGNDDFVIERDGVVIGKVGFWKLPEIGYILRPDQWRQGLASEALRAVIAHVVASRDIDALTADVDPENLASIRLLERLGFRRVGFAARTWHIGGVWKDSIYYELSRADWIRRPGDGSH